MYCLLDANVTAGYYLPSSLRSQKARQRIEVIFDSVRSKKAKHFFYIPNFCIAEVFSVFMKHAFSRWNRHVKETIDKRVYRSLVDQFQADIHNANFIYHYELSRYHILGINLVAPLDHYFKMSKGKNRPATPMGTFDQLIISMGVHLTHIHGKESVVILTTDDRLSQIADKCRKGLPEKTIKKLKLHIAKEVTGRAFSPDIFPLCLNLKDATNRRMTEIFGEWPLPVGRVAKVYRHKK